MQKSYSIAEARNQLTKLVREAEAEYTVQLTRRGKPVAILVSVDVFEELNRSKSDTTRFYDRIMAWRAEHITDDMENDGVWDDVRDKSPGREIDFSSWDESSNDAPSP